ncbi:acyltransferase [Edaphobacter paludis]|uniref:Acyltransferase n=1 Tax=Edaphobacter paludis TaxID=3035702 RepID=A0AAU7D4S8_9BACT
MQLRRITTSGNWIPEIDGLRFIAIVATLLVHMFGEVYTRSGHDFISQYHYDFFKLVDRGDRGVSLFFVISGFILAQPFLRQHLEHAKAVSIKGYFKRRLTRLEPPYILSLLLYLFAVSLFKHQFLSLLPHFFAQVFYLHNFIFNYGSLNFVTWSLEVEVQFYIVAPLLGYLYAISRPVLRRGIMICLIVASILIQVHGGQSLIAWNFPGQLQFFLVGFLIADVRATQTKSWQSRRWDLASLLVWPAIFGLEKSNFFAFLFPVLIFIAYLAAFNGPVSRGIFQTKWIALTGGMCYSFYLMHMLVIDCVFKFTKKIIIPSSLMLSFSSQVFLLGICIYIFCTFYFVLIERPCMDPKWPGKLMARIRNRRHSPSDMIAGD